MDGSLAAGATQRLYPRPSFHLTFQVVPSEVHSRNTRLSRPIHLPPLD